jgi:hypothetical protein
MKRGGRLREKSSIDRAAKIPSEWPKSDLIISRDSVITILRSKVVLPQKHTLQEANATSWITQRRLDSC